MVSVEKTQLMLDFYAVGFFYAFDDIRSALKGYVGKKILFVFGKNYGMTVYAKVLEVMPNSLRLKIVNIHTSRCYEIDMSPAYLKEVISD